MAPSEAEPPVMLKVPEAARLARVGTLAIRTASERIEFRTCASDAIS